MCKNHFYTFIRAPNTQIQDMFVDTVCLRSHDTLNGGGFGLMQGTNSFFLNLNYSPIYTISFEEILIFFFLIVHNIYHTE